MEKGAKKKLQVSNGALVAVLGGLLVIIICLVVGIVVVPKMGEQGEEAQQVAQGEQGNQEDEPAGIVGPERSGIFSEDEQQKFYDEYELVSQFNSDIRPLNTEDSQAYLDEKLAEYAGTSMENRIMVMKTWVYLNDGMPTEAMEVISQVDESNLDEQQKVDYYEVMSEANKGVGNSDSADEYIKKWRAQYLKVLGEEES